MKIRFKLISVLLSAVIILPLCFFETSAADRKKDFTEKISLLRDYIFSDSHLESDIANELKNSFGSVKYTVFISVSDRETRAATVSGNGQTLSEAWDNAEGAALDFVDKNNKRSVYIKADLVNYMKYVTPDELTELIKQAGYGSYFRQGIAFDPSFSTAFLEGEINAGKLINYGESKSLDLNAVNRYQKENGKKTVGKIPEKLITFSCRGYIYENGKNYTLEFERNLNYGRRIIKDVTGRYITSIINNASLRLGTMTEKDGKFTYGYYPCDDKKIGGYSILRHAGTLWSQICSYRLTGNEKLVPNIEKALEYLISEVVYKDKNTAFLAEKSSKEIKSGGNGIILLALTEYMDVFGTDKYAELAVQLGNGIIDMLDIKTGEYSHVYYYGEPGKKDFTLKDKYRIVYYDGEATFGLLRLYASVGGEKYLNAAKTAVGNFINKNYETIGDHWVAYTMNEMTKVLPTEEYYEFALKNVNINLTKYYKKKLAGHINLEMLMSTFELYDRIISTEARVKYLDEFKADDFIKTIFERADFHLNAYFYPEQAIYFKNPDSIIRSFFIRNDSFRVRIDDVQHFIGGYYLYAKNYGRLIKYKNLYS